jgi:hypothetical protein
MLKRRLSILVVLSIFSVLVSAGAQVMASPATPGFHAAVLMPGSSGGTEPSLGISKNGVRYVSWQSPGEFARSADGANFAQPAQPAPDSRASGDVTNAVSFSGALYNGQICGSATTLHSCIYRSLPAPRPQAGSRSPTSFQPASHLHPPHRAPGRARGRRPSHATSGSSPGMRARRSTSSSTSRRRRAER